MGFLNAESINFFLFVAGLLALTLILIYTAFAGEDVEEDEESSST